MTNFHVTNYWYIELLDECTVYHNGVYSVTGKVDVCYLFRKLLSSRPKISERSFWIDPVQKLEGLKVERKLWYESL